MLKWINFEALTMTCVMGPVKYLCQFTFSRIDLMTVSAAISEICTIGSVSLSQTQSCCQGLTLWDSSHISEEHFSIHKHCQSPGQLRTMKGNLNSLSNGFRCSLISPDVPSQVQSSVGRGKVWIVCNSSCQEIKYFCHQKIYLHLALFVKTDTNLASRIILCKS